MKYIFMNCREKLIFFERINIDLSNLDSGIYYYYIRNFNSNTIEIGKIIKIVP